MRKRNFGDVLFCIIKLYHHMLLMPSLENELEILFGELKKLRKIQKQLSLLEKKYNNLEFIVREVSNKAEGYILIGTQNTITSLTKFENNNFEYFDKGDDSIESLRSEINRTINNNHIILEAYSKMVSTIHRLLFQNRSHIDFRKITASVTELKEALKRDDFKSLENEYISILYG